MPTRLSRLDPASGALMAAASVLGTGWSTLADVAQVAALPAPDTAADELVDAGLMQVREVDSIVHVRTAHALMRSAVYRGIPLRE